MTAAVLLYALDPSGKPTPVYLSNLGGDGTGGGTGGDQYGEGNTTNPAIGTVFLARKNEALTALVLNNAGALVTDSSGSTQPVSAVTLPLPTGAATETTLSGLSGKLPSELVSDRLKVDGSGVTQPVSGSVSITSSALPTGAATEATLSALSAKLPSALVSGRLVVDGSATTQPISATALPLPNGAATEATLSALSAKLPSALVSGRLSVDNSGVTQPISATALPLPTGAATEATLGAVSGKLPAALVNGRLAVESQIGISNGSHYRSIRSSAGAVVRASGTARVYAVFCQNLNSSTAYYFQLFNRSTGPSGAPVESYLVYPNSTLILGIDFFTDAGVTFATGISWGLSTTADNYVAGNAADAIVVIRFN